MKKYIMVSLLTVLTLVGCNSEVVPVSSESEAENKEINSEEVEGVREQLESQVNELSNELETKVAEVGYLTAPEYEEFSGKVNLIAQAIESSAIIETNDNVGIRESLDVLLRDINSVPDTIILEAEESVNSSRSIYIAQFQEVLNRWMSFIDLNGENNRLDQFILVYGNSESTIEIQEKSQWYIEQLQEVEYKNIVELEERLNDRKSQFSESEYDHLNSVLQNLKSSIDYQIEVFEEFGSIKVESDMSVTEKVNQAEGNYLKAETELQLLESELGISQ